MENEKKTAEMTYDDKKLALQNGIKKIPELTVEEVKQLPVADFSLLRTVSKKTGTEHFSMSFKLARGLTVNVYVEEATFEIIVRKYNFPSGYNRYNGKCHYRLSRGVRPDKSIYYFVEMIVARALVMRSFLTEAQATQIEVCELEKEGLKIFDRGSNMDDVVADKEVKVLD